MVVCKCVVVWSFSISIGLNYTSLSSSVPSHLLSLSSSVTSHLLSLIFCHKFLSMLFVAFFVFRMYATTTLGTAVVELIQFYATGLCFVYLSVSI